MPPDVASSSTCKRPKSPPACRPVIAAYARGPLAVPVATAAGGPQWQPKWRAVEPRVSERTRRLSGVRANLRLVSRPPAPTDAAESYRRFDCVGGALRRHVQFERDGVVRLCRLRRRAHERIRVAQLPPAKRTARARSALGSGSVAHEQRPRRRIRYADHHTFCDNVLRRRW